MSVQFPYRAIICGEEHIVKNWQGRKLWTDKGVFYIGLIYEDWRIQNYRLFEVAMIQADGNDGWLVNGKPLSFVENLRMGSRFGQISKDENLRVYKNKIRAAAWFDCAGNFPKTTDLLDEIKKSWALSAMPPVAKEEKEATTIPELLSIAAGELSGALSEMAKFQRLFPTWSNPVWLSEFRPAGKKIAISPEQKELAKAKAELAKTQKQLRKAEVAAGDSLKEALLKWLRFDPVGMSADTKARIEKAVKLYVTEREKFGSLSKIAAEFKVSRKTVSGWFKTFKDETGFPIITHRRHESVKEHLRADSEQEEEE